MALSLDGTTGISASGNIVGNNISVFGTLSVGSFNPSTISVSGNVTGGNIATAGLVSAAGNIDGGNLNVTGNIVDTGALSIISGSNGNIALVPNGTGTVTASSALSVSGNVTGGNVTTAGLVTATGNVQGGNVVTGGLVSATGNVTGGNIRTAGSITASGGIFSNGTITAGTGFNGGTGTFTTIVATTSIQTNPGVFASITGNVTGGNILTAGLISATGGITGAAITGTSLTVSTGNITCGNIVNANGNGVGNIGSASNYFNTVFAKATSAQYADLAEMYVADQAYTPGTVLEFGGVNEVTKTTQSHSTRVAGIVSTRPSYLMNATQTGVHVVPVALTGRVPCQVIGTIAKGDRLVASDIPGVATVLESAQYQPACIIGKALENYSSEEIGTIEVAVGRT